MRKTITGVGMSIRSENANEHITLGMITFREGLEGGGRARSRLDTFKVRFSCSVSSLVHRTAKTYFRLKMSQKHQRKQHYVLQ